MADILLIQPPIRDYYLTAKRTMPYGLACIAASLIREGFSVDLIDGLARAKSRVVPPPPEMAYLRRYYAEADRSPFALFTQYKHYGYSYDHLGKSARDSGADLVGISAMYAPYFQETLRTAEAVKTHHPTCTVAVGGHHATAMPESILASEAVDYVLRGDGEKTLPQLARALRNGAGLDTVSGLAYRQSEKRFCIRPPTFLKRLPEILLPAMYLLNQRYYRRRRRGSTVVVASRGCPLSCSYCAMGSQGGPPYRRRSVDSVLNEVEVAADREGAGFVDFEDENLSLNRRWFLDLLHRLYDKFKDRHLELRAMNGLLPASLDEEVIAAMAKAGFKTLNLSLGTVSPAQQRRFQRPDMREDFDRVLALAEKYRLNAVGYIIAAAPFQKAVDSVADLLFLARRRVLIGLSIYYPAPGSPDFQRCQTLGLLPDSPALWRSSALPIAHTTSRLEAVTLLRLARIINFMKALIDEGVELPEPACAPKMAPLANSDRKEAGHRLLADFFYDGIIRGIDATGHPFEHPTARHLTRLFNERFNIAKIKGTGRNMHRKSTSQIGNRHKRDN